MLIVPLNTNRPNIWCNCRIVGLMRLGRLLLAGRWWSRCRMFSSGSWCSVHKADLFVSRGNGELVVWHFQHHYYEYMLWSFVCPSCVSQVSVLRKWLNMSPYNQYCIVTLISGAKALDEIPLDYPQQIKMV